jgi:hypothetical protein
MRQRTIRGIWFSVLGSPFSVLRSYLRTENRELRTHRFTRTRVAPTPTTSVPSKTMDQIIFVSLFLGLVTGTQWIELRAGPAVKAVRITLGGHEIAALRQPPWQAAVNFGPGLEPGELVATGYDDRGDEVARATQILNLPRPVAELEIVLRSEHGKPAAVELVWRHREHSRPKSAAITVDGTRLRLAKDFSGSLPRLDDSHPHVLTAEMRFNDGAVARGEMVIRGGFSDSVGTQLTPIVLTRTLPQEPATLEGCLTVGGQPVRTSAVEKANALVIVVKDPNPAEAETVLDPKRAMRHRGVQGDLLHREMQLDPNTGERILWPVALEMAEPGQPSTKLFQPSTDQPATNGGMRWLLTRSFPLKDSSAHRQFADAVAVAGLKALIQGRRRAVVLLLSNTPDTSHHSPATVRRYLAAIGVPLFVWSLTGPRPDLADSWGLVDDISTSEALRAATDRLRETLASQRVAWVALDPLTALRVEANERCGLSPVARLQ